MRIWKSSQNSYPAFVESKKVLARKVEFDRAQKKRHRAKAKGGAKVWKMIQNLIRSTSSSQEEENKEEEQEDGVDDGENEQLQEEEDLLLYLLSLNEEEDENQKQNGNAEVNNRTTGTTKPDELIEKARPFLNDYPWLFEHKFDKKGIAVIFVKLIICSALLSTLDAANFDQKTTLTTDFFLLSFDFLTPTNKATAVSVL